MKQKTRKIIPCLDMKDGKVVKGIHFENIKEMGDPIQLAKKYENAGADELAFLDIAKTNDGHAFYLDLIADISKTISIPLSVGGGIASLEDVKMVLNAGASKVSIASAAVFNPDLIFQAVKKFGKGKIIIALDIAKDLQENKYYVYTNGGMKKSTFEVFEIMKKFNSVDIAAYLITGISFDGAKTGFDIDFFQTAQRMTNVPLIASGGAGNIQDFVELFQKTNVEYGLAASIFHQNLVDIRELKEVLTENGIAVNR